jgi:hypothetical protein
MNREMLKEAIAEAKTIKETAIANAKAALEEAFTPQLTAMFAEKLNEEEEEEELKENTTDMGSDELEESFNLDEILAELEMTDEADEMVSEEDMDKMDEDLMLEEMSDEEIEELVMKVIDDMIETGKLMPGEGEEEEEDMEDVEDMEDMGDMEDMEVEDEEEVELDELLNELLDEEKDEVKETMFADAGTLQLVAQAADALNISKDAVMAMIAGLPATVAAAGFLRGVLKGKKEATKEEVEETADTKEMEETINELRNELNEVNLLNAKLLYTNKIFKAKNLTESEKVKVLNTFDKAETVKEVKLVFETLTESFIASAKKSPIKESLGSASRSIAPAQTKQPIIEVNDAFARMQRLAGLKK